MLTMFRLATAVKSGGKALIKPCDFLEQTQKTELDRNGKEKEHIKISEVFFGRSFWEPRFVYVSI